MSEENTSVKVRADNNMTEVSVMDLLNLSPEAFEEVRGTLVAPAGIVQLRVKEWKQDVREMRRTDIDGERHKTAVIMFDFEILGYEKVKDASVEPQDWVGKKFQEMFSIRDVREDIGRVKAFCTDIGVSGNFESFTDMLNDTINREFVTSISHNKYKDNNGNERVAANMDRSAVSPLTAS